MGQHPSLGANIVSFMSNMYFIIRLIGIGSDQNIWHLSAAAWNTFPWPKYLQIASIHLSVFLTSRGIISTVGGKVKTLLFLTLRVKCSATKVFWAEIKFGSFSLDLIESGQYNERESGVSQWEASITEFDQSEDTLPIDHCPEHNEAWNVSSALGSFCPIRTEKIKVLCFCCGPENW